MRQLKITKSTTYRDETLEKYFTEIAQVDLITPEEEVQLAIRIKQGDQAALEKLTKANLRFVVSVAKQYQHQGLSLSDLINEGNLGLIKAAQRFDETRGFKFITPAVWWIRQSILQALAEQSRLVRLPLNKIGLSNKIKKAYSQLEQEYEREPSTEELAELLEIGTLEVETTLGIAARHVSVDAPFIEDEGVGTMLDMLENPNSPPADEEVEKESLCRQIELALEDLNENQREVLIFYYGLLGIPPMDTEEIAGKLGTSRSYVTGLKERALQQIRRSAHLRLLKEYMG